MPEPIVYCVLGLTWVGWHLANKKLYADSLSPLNVLLYCWVIPFILCLLRLSGLQVGINPTAFCVVAISTVILMATCMLPAVLDNVRRNPELSERASRQVLINPIGIVAFYLGTNIALYFAEFSDRELPLIVYLLGGATDSNLHTAGKDSSLQFIAFGSHVAAMFVFFLWLLERRRWRRFIYLVLAIAAVVLGLVKTSKSDIFITVLSYAGVIHYYYRSQNHKLPAGYKITAIVMMLVVVSVTAIRLQGAGLHGGYAGLIEFRYSKELGEATSEAVSIVYGYLALGFENFSNYVNSHVIEFRLGTSFFRPLLSMFMRGDVADAMSVPVDQWHVVSDAANTGTFLTPLYIEGGALLCYLGSLVYGLMVNMIYLIFRSTRTTRWMFAYSSFLFPWTWLFFTNAFSVLSIYVNLFYVFALSWLFVRDEPTQRFVVAVVDRSGDHTQVHGRIR
jgi:oligosaccharide repeat unit polymerase